jgi:hypothetical protein
VPRVIREHDKEALKQKPHPGLSPRPSPHLLNRRKSVNIAIGSMHVLTLAAPLSVSAACIVPIAGERERMIFEIEVYAPATHSW